MKRLISIFIATLFLLSLPLSVVNAEKTSNFVIYVATDGNDANEGTIDSPLATLFGARDKIREIKKTSGLPEGGIKVYVRGGLYTLEESFVLTEEDSGTESSPIVYQEYPGEKVEITGGVYIPGKDFKKVRDEKVLERFYPEVKNKIVSVNLADYGFNDFGTWEYKGEEYQPWELAGETIRQAVPGLMVFCDDEPLDIARVPNRNDKLGWDYYEVGDKSKIKAASNGVGQTFEYTDDRIEKWPTYEDVAVYGFWSESWKFESSAINSVDYKNKTVTLKNKVGSGPQPGRRYVYINVLDELDSPGEYYVDKNSGILYMYARENLKNEKIGVTKFGRDATKDHLIFFDHASYITFRGFNVTLARTNGIYVTWNDKMTEIWTLVTTSPENFKGGTVWGVVQGINGGLQAIGLGLLVLFFAMSIFKSTASFRDFQRPEYALRHFIRFVAAKVAVTYAMDLMIALYEICGGVVSQIAGSLGGVGSAAVTLPSAIETAAEDAGFWASIPLWLVTILGSLFITIMAFIMIMSVYGRFFRLYMYTALAPVPLSSFAGEGTSEMGKHFVKSYVGVCLEGAVIVLACIIFTAFSSSSTPTLDTSITTVTMIWKYIGETIFNMLVLVGLIKGSDRIIKEMLGT